MAGEDTPEGTPGTGGDEPEKGPNRQALSEVLASIRALVSAETSARMHEPEDSEDDVLMLTRDMRVDPRAEMRPPEPAGGFGLLSAGGAPILDEESLRVMINAIVREELQGELGQSIGRDLRKIVRREVEEALRAERRGE